MPASVQLVLDGSNSNSSLIALGYATRIVAAYSQEVELERIESMPRPIQLLSLLSPLRYYLEIGLGIFLKGVGVTELWRQAVAMTVLGLGIFGLGLWRFRRQLRWRAGA